ncbi:MAG: hypothetical protein A2Y69_09505 [Candidatus Aminicenantes bacterium RBG_13_59_9]|nr:MAG: hypothetical protein A2Y69_09505 [Candidatus Aminicenantes bacterium RBG_13_59_9]
MINTRFPRAFLLAMLLTCACVPAVLAQSAPRWFVDFEAGSVFPGYCDVRIPGGTGTLFSLTDDFSTSSSLFVRLRAGFRLHPRHTLMVLFAPLALVGVGRVDFPLDFNGLTFPANTPLDSVYRFNSYRLSWRYGLMEGRRLRIGLGLTAKIRDAGIEITGGVLTSQKTNVGFVPLLNFLLEWRFSSVLRLLLEGDAAAAPQGRAEDVQLAVVYQKSEKWALRLGYRILEGGADNEKVYNFALLNYVLVGATVYF